MKKNDKETNPQIRVALRVLPFGNLIYETAGPEYPAQERELKAPKYVEQPTTNIQQAEIRHGRDGIYLVPETTA